MRRRIASLPLGAKLAWLSAALIAVFVAAAMIPLSVSTRRATRRIVAAQLEQTQRALLENQRRELARLEYTARLIGQSSTIMAAIAEDRSQGGQRRRQNASRSIDPAYLATARAALEEALPRTDEDIIAITDDSGRVFTAMSRAGRSPLESGADLSSLPAVHVALDPAAPADTGVYGVLDLPSSVYSVAAVPLVSAGRTLGAIIIGRRIDSTYLGSLGRVFDGSVVVLSGERVVAATGDLVASDLAPLMRDSTAPAAELRVKGEAVAAAPLSLGANREGAPVTLWLLQPVGQLSAQITRPLLLQFVLYGLIAVVLSGIGAAAVAGSVLQPLDRFIRYLRGTSSEIQPAQLDPPRFVVGDGSPEIHELNNSFAALMASLREREAQLRQSQKLEAIGTLAGGVAHDFNNLLTVITGYTQLALRRMAPEDTLRDDLRQVIEASDRAARLTQQLLAFGRKQVFQPTVVDLSEVVDGVAPMLKRLIGEHIEMRIDAQTPLAHIVADRGQLEQVIINLVVNARDAMPKGGTLTIRTANIPGDRVMLLVTDTGIGISPEVRERIFEPFFTTKEAGKGTGLGLATVYGIVKQTGGQIEIDTEVGRGTTFRVLLPVGGDEIESMPSAVEQPMPRGDESILLVEDEPEVRALARRTLEGLGYTVVASTDSDEAVKLGSAGNSRFDLLLTDIVMPGASGPEIVRRLAANGTKPIIVYMSGYADDALKHHTLEPESTFLRKPFHPAELAQTIRGALDRARARSVR
jgi:signal transduction histidine kinase/CheY-like chemotaxis protein